MLHFSPRHGPEALHGVRRRPMRLVAANDNPAGQSSREVPLATALKMFASHGLSAAAQAGQSARDAARMGDEAGFHHWLAVCRSLDRRLAIEIEKRRARGGL